MVKEEKKYMSQLVLRENVPYVSNSVNSDKTVDKEDAHVEQKYEHLVTDISHEKITFFTW